MRVGARAAAIAVAAALAGCGGDDGGGEDRPAAPRSAEAEEATLDRLGQEVEQKRCRDPRAAWHSGVGPIPRKACQEAFRYFDGFAIGDLRPYGPAAVVAFGEAGFNTVGLVLDRDRRYRVVAVTTKLRARPTPKSDRIAERAVEAIADEDCAALSTLAADTGEGGDPCEQKPVAAFSRALDAAGDPPKPRRLGGEGGIGFYEVKVGERFYVLVMVEGDRGELGFANVYAAG